MGRAIRPGYGGELARGNEETCNLTSELFAHRGLAYRLDKSERRLRQTTDRTPVRNPLAFLVTATTRLAINVLHSARARKEIEAGPWLPEPIDADALISRAVENGVIYVAGEAFFVSGTAVRARNIVRLSFSAPTPERIRAGVSRLAKAIRAELSAVTSGTAAERPASR